MVFEKNIFWKYQNISIIRNHFLFKDNAALDLKKLEFPLPNDGLCHLGLKHPIGSGENVKQLQQQYQQQQRRWQTTNKSWSENLFWLFDSGELKMQ